MERKLARATAAVLGLVFAALVALLMSGPALAYDKDAPSIVTKGATIGSRGLYIVQEGDTLWYLSDIFFGEPFFWPTLWSFNPQLTSPHWIYPGDVVQIRQPKPLSETTIVWSESRFSKRKSDLEIVARYVGYLPDRPFRRSGQIEMSREPKTWLGTYDEIYVTFGDDVRVKRGEEFTLYRQLGELYHPHDDDIVVGHRIKHLGRAKVLDADKRYVKCVILDAYEEIQRGDLVTSAFPHSWIVGPVPNTADAVATIVALDDPTRFAGQYQYLFLDKGRNDGVRRGNRLLIERRGDGLWFDGEPDDDEVDLDQLPWENEGEVLVVEAFEETSLALVSRAIAEIAAGDRAVLTKGY